MGCRTIHACLSVEVDGDESPGGQVEQERLRGRCAVDGHNAERCSPIDATGVVDHDPLGAALGRSASGEGDHRGRLLPPELEAETGRGLCPVGALREPGDDEPSPGPDRDGELTVALDHLPQLHQPGGSGRHDEATKLGGDTDTLCARDLDVDAGIRREGVGEPQSSAVAPLGVERREERLGRSAGGARGCVSAAGSRQPLLDADPPAIGLDDDR